MKVSKVVNGVFHLHQVNKSSCEFCAYHVTKAYKNLSSKRPDLQSAFSGNADVRARIMNKIAPKGIFFQPKYLKY